MLSVEPSLTPALPLLVSGDFHGASCHTGFKPFPLVLFDNVETVADGAVYCEGLERSEVKPSLIPIPADQNLSAQSRIPIDMMRQG